MLVGKKKKKKIATWQCRSVVDPGHVVRDQEPIWSNQKARFKFTRLTVMQPYDKTIGTSSLASINQVGGYSSEGKSGKSVRDQGQGIAGSWT